MRRQFGPVLLREEGADGGTLVCLDQVQLVGVGTLEIVARHMIRVLIV